MYFFRIDAISQEFAHCFKGLRIGHIVVERTRIGHNPAKQALGSQLIYKRLQAHCFHHVEDQLGCRRIFGVRYQQVGKTLRIGMVVDQGSGAFKCLEQSLHVARTRQMVKIQPDQHPGRFYDFGRFFALGIKNDNLPASNHPFIKIRISIRRYNKHLFPGILQHPCQTQCRTNSIAIGIHMRNNYNRRSN